VKTPAPLPGYAERTLIVPKGVVLSDDEITAVLTAADARKRGGDRGVTVSDEGPGYSIAVPTSCALTREEAVIVLTRTIQAKEAGHSDLLLTFADGALVRNWLTLKSRGPGQGPDAPIGPEIIGRAARKNF